MPEIPTTIEPDWRAPDNVLAFSTTRRGGHSAAPYDSLNLGHHVADDDDHVVANRALLAPLLPRDTRVQWLQQVHGNGVIEADLAAEYPRADASWCRQPGTACAVLSADCLPVLLCSSSGNVVAAAHAGWRGLLSGILEATVAAMKENPGSLLAWMGPAIGPGAFEVGAEVRERFLHQSGGMLQATEDCFVPSESRRGHYFANLYALARLRLEVAGVTETYGGDLCTYSSPERFYSYRRDGQTGRMASLIMLRQGD